MKGRSHRLASTEPPDDWVNGGWTVDCVCGVTFDDGEEMVDCDECQVWVHTRCVRYNIKGKNSYVCDTCKSKKNRNDNEETEVAQLLVELTTKTMRMDNLCRPSVPPRPAFRLWKDVPMEEKVHVQGVPGGDPALFQGLSSVFTSELWKCTGYVPKKFNFQYREFPCWDEKEEVGARVEEGIENPVDRGADVLFSLSKEIVSAKPAEMEVSLRGYLEQDDCERKSSPKEKKKREGNDPSVKFVQNDGKKDRSNLLTLAVHSCKQKEELVRSKERSGKKKYRNADKEADGKRRASTPCVVENKLEFHDDEGFKVCVTDLPNEVRIVQEHDGGCLDVGVNGDRLKDELAANVSPAKYVLDEASRHKFPLEMVGKLEKANHRSPAKSDDSPGSGNGVPLLMVSNDACGLLTEDVNLAVDGLKHLKDENHDQKDRDLKGNCSSVLVDSQRLDPPVRDLHTTVPEVQVNHMLVDSNGGLTSFQHNSKVKTQVDDEQPRGGLDLLSSVSDIKLDSPRNWDPCVVKATVTHPSKKLHVLDHAVGSLPSGDDRTQGGNSEAVGHCDRSDAMEGVISSSCEPPQHEQDLERSAEMLSAQMGSLESKHYSKYFEEPSGSGGVSPRSQAPVGPRKDIVGAGKSPTTSGIVISKSSVSASCKNPGTITSPVAPRSINSTKQRVKTNSSADNKKDHAMNRGKDDLRHEALGKPAKEPLKTYASSGLKASQTSRISQASTSKRTMSDAKEQVLYPSSKASVMHNVAVSLGSGESPGSLQTQNSSHVQNKVSASGFSQKGERYNQSSCQPPSKVNHSPSMNPPAPVNSSATLSDEELALLLHQELNSSPRVPRVPRVRHAGTVPQLGSSTTASLLIKRSTGSGAKDQILVSRRKKEDAPRNGSRNPSEFIDETKKKERIPSYPDQRRHDPVCATDGPSKNEASNGSPDLVASSKKNVLVASPSTTGGVQLSSIGANDRSLSSIRSSLRDMSDEDVGANVEPTPRTLPGLLDEIMSKGKRMTYEDLCSAVLPHWQNLRKHNGERYAYSSHSQAVLDCLRNRNEWAQLIDRGPKTNAGRKKRKLDSDLPVVDSVGIEYDKRNLKEVEVKYVESQREDFPKGKRKARKRRRLALQGRGIKDVRRRRKADAIDSDLGGFSQSSEGAGSIFSEDESQASTDSDETGSMK